MSKKLHDCLRDLNEEAEMQRLVLLRINTSKAIYLSPSYSADDDERGEGGSSGSKGDLLCQRQAAPPGSSGRGARRLPLMLILSTC